MARNDTPFDRILEAVKTRLQSQLGLTEANCYIADDPDRVDPSAGEYVYVITPDLVFPFIQGNLIGGGRAQLSCRGIVFVTVHAFLQLDQAERADIKFTNEELGLYAKMTGVLRALAIEELQDAAQNNLLNQPMHPLQVLVDVADRSHCSIMLHLELEFDWSLA